MENGLLSSLGSTVSGPGVDGTDWTGTNGLTVIADKLYHVHTDGTLRRTDLVAGRPVMATTVVVSGPTVGGLNWANTVALHTRGQAAPPPPPPPDHLFENHFDDLNGWTTLSGLTLDATAGAPAGAAPSGLGDVNGTKAFARQALGSSYQAICSAVSIRVNRLTTSTVLMRLRTADNQAGARVFATANGTLYIRSDVAGQQLASSARLVTGTWARLELCATAGPTGTLTLTVDGAQVGVLHREHGHGRLRHGRDRRGGEQHLVRQLRRRGGRRPDLSAANRTFRPRWAR